MHLVGLGKQLHKTQQVANDFDESDPNKNNRRRSKNQMGMARSVVSNTPENVCRFGVG